MIWLAAMASPAYDLADDRVSAGISFHLLGGDRQICATLKTLGSDEQTSGSPLVFGNGSLESTSALA